MFSFIFNSQSALLSDSPLHVPTHWYVSFPEPVQVPGSFGPVGVPVSGFTMLQHQIKVVHESAHQEEKQRQDQGDLDRRPPFSTRSPTILDRDGRRKGKIKVIILSSPLCCLSPL